MADAIPSLVNACLLLTLAVGLTDGPLPALCCSPPASVKWINGVRPDLPSDPWFCKLLYKDEAGRGGDILGEPGDGEIEGFGDCGRAKVEGTTMGFWSRATGVGIGAPQLDSHTGRDVKGSGSAALALSPVTLAMNVDGGLRWKDKDAGGCGGFRSSDAGGVINWTCSLGGGGCCGGLEQGGVIGEREQGGVPLAITTWTLWASFWPVGCAWVGWTLNFGSWASLVRGVEDDLSSSNPNIV